jgi:hypothetical protein
MMTEHGSAFRPASRSHSALARTLAVAMTAVLALAGAVAQGAVPTKATHAHAGKPRHVGVFAETGTPARARGHKASVQSLPHRTARNARSRAAAERADVAWLRRHPARASHHAPEAIKRASLEGGESLRAERATTHGEPAKVAPVGGELTADDFFRAASGSAEAKVEKTPMMPAEQVVAPISAHIVMAAKAPQASILLDDDARGELAEVASTAATDARAVELAHPSRQEMAEEAGQPMVLPGLYRNGRLVVPAPLKGSREVLVHQNQMADDEGLERIRDDYALNRLRAAHQLVSLQESVSLRVNPELNGDRRCARVWTVQFAGDMAKSFYARFHEPLQVNSAVRTIAYQVRLQRTNGNAAGIGGEAASPHLTGQAIDIGKRGMSVAEIAWMRAYLKPLMDVGKVDVEEEFQQACFHISVYKTYLPASRRGVDVAQVRKPVVSDVR